MSLIRPLKNNGDFLVFIDLVTSDNVNAKMSEGHLTAFWESPI